MFLLVTNVNISHILGEFNNVPCYYGHTLKFNYVMLEMTHRLKNTKSLSRESTKTKHHLVNSSRTRLFSSSPGISSPLRCLRDFQKEYKSSVILFLDTHHANMYAGG